MQKFFTGKKKKNTSQNSKIVNRGGRSYKGQTISLVIYSRSFQFFSCFKYVGGNSLSINFCICKVKKMFASSKSGGREGGRDSPCLTISPPPLACSFPVTLLLFFSLIFDFFFLVKTKFT